MDVLKDKSYSSTKNYVSRYDNFPNYYNTEDDKYVAGLTSQLKTDVSYVAHNVTVRDTLDSLALKYYGRPDYYWIIADFNRIQDPFIKLSEHFTTIKIPALAAISYED